MKQRRAAFLAEVQGIDPARFIFLDESGSNAAMAREYGRAPRGRRVHDDRPVNYGLNLTIVGGLSLRGFDAVMTIPGAADGDVFRAYVTEVLVPVLRPDHVVVMDNLSVHKVRGVREAIEATGARLLYLPPYSPDFNPIEKAWSKLKSLLRELAARTIDTLHDAVALSITRVSPENCAGWFMSCGYEAST